MFAIARSDAFRAAVDQAGGALTWPRSAALREALTAAAKQTTTPVMLMVAKNDRTTESITTLAAVLKRRNAIHDSIVYPDFTPASVPAGVAPGHMIFGASGVDIWKRDVVAFFDKYLK